MSARSKYPVLSRLAAVTVLTALCARAIIPVGYMPGNLVVGELMVLCPVASRGALRVLGAETPHHHHGESDSESTSSADAICPIGTALNWDVVTSDLPTPLPGDRISSLRFVDIASVHRPELQHAYLSRAPPTA